MLGELVGKGIVHALDRQQILRRLVFLDVLFHGQCLGEQGVLGTGTQLLDDVLVKAFHREQLAGWHVGDFLHRGEALLHEDVGDLRINLELLHEELTRSFLLALALLAHLRLGHDVELPA